MHSTKAIETWLAGETGQGVGGREFLHRQCRRPRAMARGFRPPERLRALGRRLRLRAGRQIWGMLIPQSSNLRVSLFLDRVVGHWELPAISLPPESQRLSRRKCAHSSKVSSAHFVRPPERPPPRVRPCAYSPSALDRKWHRAWFHQPVLPGVASFQGRHFSLAGRRVLCDRICAVSVSRVRCTTRKSREILCDKRTNCRHALRVAWCCRRREKEVRMRWSG